MTKESCKECTIVVKAAVFLPERTYSQTMDVDSESWEPSESAEDSDSEWEPPPKRRKLSKKVTKTRKQKKKKQKAKVSLRRRKRKTPKQHIRKAKSNANNRKSCAKHVDSDSDIEMLPKYHTKSSTKKKKTKAKTKSKKNLKKKRFKAVSSAIIKISNPDALISGYYRNLSVCSNDFNIIPTDITEIIFKYQQNIKYVEINFVWTHKYSCCQTYAKCKYLKNNRGAYVFERECDNAFDENAIKIITKCGKQVGHVPRDYAACLAPLLDENKIDLQCVGGSRTRPCSEMVEVIPLTKLTNEEMRSFESILEEAPFDINRFVRSSG